MEVIILLLTYFISIHLKTLSREKEEEKKSSKTK